MYDILRFSIIARYALFASAVILTALAIYEPIWNAFALISLSPPNMYLSYLVAKFHQK